MGENFIREIEEIKGIDDLHIYRTKDLEVFTDANENFLSDDFKKSLNLGKKDEKNLYARIYFLADEDFEKILEEKGYSKDMSYLLLNKMSEDNSTAYAFRNYIPVTDKNDRKIRLFKDKDNPIEIKIDGFVDKMAYDIASYENNQIAIFARSSNYENFMEENSEIDPINYYIVRIRSTSDLSELSENIESII